MSSDRWIDRSNCGVDAISGHADKISMCSMSHTQRDTVNWQTTCCWWCWLVLASTVTFKFIPRNLAKSYWHKTCVIDIQARVHLFGLSIRLSFQYTSKKLNTPDQWWSETHFTIPMRKSSNNTIHNIRLDRRLIK